MQDNKSKINRKARKTQISFSVLLSVDSIFDPLFPSCNVMSSASQDDSLLR